MAPPRAPTGPAVPAAGSWVGTPQNGVASNTTRSSQAGVAGALGLTPEEIERRKAQTGVDPGATGYVSGQTTPGVHSALDALGAPGGVPTTARNAGPTPAPAPPPGMGDTTTVTSGLTSGTPDGVPRGAPLTATPPAGDVTTRTSGLSNAPNSGTTSGTPIIPNTPSTGNSTIDQGINGVRDYLTPKLGDTGPSAASQRAAFGLSDDLNRERYDYRPGAAAAQDVVELNKQQMDETRARQNQALESLTAAANGTVPSAAELQMRQEAGRNVAATLGQARALGGRSAGGAARAGTLASADILAKNSVEGAQLRAAEQDRNRQQLMSALGGVREQDIGTSKADADLRNQAYQNNLRSQLEQNDLAEKHRQALLDSQLKALGIGTNAAGDIVGAGIKNAETENKFKGGGLSALGDLAAWL